MKLFGRCRFAATLPSSGLSPQAVSALRAAAVIAGELLAVLVISAALIIPAIFAGA